MNATKKGLSKEIQKQLRQKDMNPFGQQFTNTKSHKNKNTRYALKGILEFDKTISLLNLL